QTDGDGGKRDVKADVQRELDARKAERVERRHRRSSTGEVSVSASASVKRVARQLLTTISSLPERRVTATPTPPDWRRKTRSTCASPTPMLRTCSSSIEAGSSG